MESAPKAFDELDKGFPVLQRNREGNDRTSSLKRKTTHVSRATPIIIANVPSDESTPSDAAAYDSRTTTPPHRLSSHNSGLPPTPPTMTNSEVADSNKDVRSSSPAPLFADRVRNALEVHKSGISTPVREQQSPPTPDPSPPGHRGVGSEKLRLPRPELNHYPSSYADSFVTAQEDGSADGSTTDINVVIVEESKSTTPTQTRRSWKDTGRAMGLSNALLVVQDMEQNHDSDVEQPRVKNYHDESDSDSAKASLKNGSHVANNGQSTPEQDPPAPSVRKSMDQKAVQQRLRKPFQPGDEIKRPDESLLYGSLASIKWKEGRANKVTLPAREMDTEFLRHARPVLVDEASETLEVARSELQKNVALELQNQNQALTALPPLPLEERRPMSPRSHANTAQKLEDLSPPMSKPAPEPQNLLSNPQRASLEENNKVYKLIQEENAKRHSIVSDGSVRAVIKIDAVPEHKRKLRHTHKRDSLRGELSVVDSKRSSTDSSHKLKHKRGMTSLGSSDGPVSPVEITPPKVNGRVSRFDSGENGLGHWGGIPVLQPSKMRSVATAQVLGNPHTLRRSLRQNSLDRRSVSDSIRPLSSHFDGPPSPHLRRSSADSRLDRNMDVRRTSLGRVSELKLDKLAEEVPRVSRDERSTFRERRESSVQTSATSPRRKSFDMRHLYPIATPMSTSQWSATEAEVCEAKGVELYPHNNESLLLVHSGYRRVSAPAQIEEVQGETPSESEFDRARGEQQPTFHAFVDAPSSTDPTTGGLTMDSPLTNPRAAPAPPVIQFIPPTPNHELEEEELGHSTNQTPALQDPRKNGLQRRLSLTQRMRRYSESLVQPFPFGRSGSVRRNHPRRASHHASEERPTHLSSFWQPRDFWADYDSDEDSLENRREHEPLPPGGDTSEVREKTAASRFNIFPRNMSVRMPGFRGNGGFLVGNSLGIDRHGTNKRRHYVVAKRTSEEVLRRRRAKKRRFSLGLGLLRDRRERKAEKRREELRGQISGVKKAGGDGVWVDGRCGVE